MALKRAPQRATASLGGGLAERRAGDPDARLPFDAVLTAPHAKGPRAPGVQRAGPAQFFTLYRRKTTKGRGQGPNLNVDSGHNV